MQPVTQEERLAHIGIAKEKLDTEIPWLADTMENDLKHAFGDKNNSEFVISPEGKVLIARNWSDPDTLRSNLEKLVGKADTLTEAASPVSSFELDTAIAKGVVPRVPRPSGSEPLVVDSVKPDEDPLYLKLRAEAPRSISREGKGPLHLSFTLDPIHRVHWNNLAPPMEFTITAPEGVTVSPSTVTAEKVTEHKADRDPRDFLLEVDRGSSDDPVSLSVTYFACDDGDTWCKAITQEFAIHWKMDRDAGKIQNRGQSAGRGPGTGKGRPQGRRMPNPEAIFSRMDSNSDGSIAKDEAQGPMIERFDQMDKDKDGKVTMEELKAAFEARRRR